MKNPIDFAMGNPESKHCRHCVDDLDELKSYEEVFSDQVGFLMQKESIPQEEAEAQIKTQLSKMPAWHGKT